MYPSILNSFPVIRTASAKIAVFTYRMPTFLFLLETPLRLSRNMLHGWKDNSMLSCQTAFSRTAAHIFVSPGDVPATITQYIPWMESQFNACQTLAACTYLSSIVSSYTMLKSMRKSKNRYFYHIFVSPVDAPGAITLNVVWMEREFDAYKLSRCTCSSDYNCF